MTIRPTLRSVRAAGLVSLVLAGSVAAAACGTQQAPPLRKHQPVTQHPTHNPVTKQDASCTSQVAQLERATSGSGSQTGGPVGAAAARLFGTVVVSGASSDPSCTVLQPGQTVNLAVGDKVVFEANDAPTVTGDGASVTVSTAPGTSGPPPLSTAHVVVTVTAVQAGTVNFVWTDCSGTGC